MKILPRKLLLSGAGFALATTAVLTLPACTETTYVRESPLPSSAQYQVRGRFYHCHAGGVCHNVQHADYYWRDGLYQLRPTVHYRPHNRYHAQPRLR